MPPHTHTHKHIEREREGEIEWEVCVSNWTFYDFIWRYVRLRIMKTRSGNN